MSDYTPTTDEVRRAAVCEIVVTAAQFYRWLAAHDESVRAEERERIARAILAVDSIDWALAGEHAGEDAARIVRGEG